MRLNILSDTNWESGVDAVLDWLASTNYWTRFEADDYGDGLAGVSVFFICRSETFFKKRVRHSKKEKKLYMDIMLNLNEFVPALTEDRRRMVLSALLHEVPSVLRKYEFEEFETERFISDFCLEFNKLLDRSLGKR